MNDLVSQKVISYDSASSNGGKNMINTQQAIIARNNFQSAQMSSRHQSMLKSQHSPLNQGMHNQNADGVHSRQLLPHQKGPAISMPLAHMENVQISGMAAGNSESSLSIIGGNVHNVAQQRNRPLQLMNEDDENKRMTMNPNQMHSAGQNMISPINQMPLSTPQATVGNGSNLQQKYFQAFHADPKKTPVTTNKNLESLMEETTPIHTARVSHQDEMLSKHMYQASQATDKDILRVENQLTNFLDEHQQVNQEPSGIFETPDTANTVHKEELKHPDSIYEARQSVEEPLMITRLPYGVGRALDSRRGPTSNKTMPLVPEQTSHRASKTELPTDIPYIEGKLHLDENRKRSVFSSNVGGGHHNNRRASVAKEIFIAQDFIESELEREASDQMIREEGEGKHFKSFDQVFISENEKNSIEGGRQDQIANKNDKIAFQKRASNKQTVPPSTISSLLNQPQQALQYNINHGQRTSDSAAAQKFSNSQFPKISKEDDESRQMSELIRILGEEPTRNAPAKPGPSYAKLAFNNLNNENKFDARKSIESFEFESESTKNDQPTIKFLMKNNIETAAVPIDRKCNKLSDRSPIPEKPILNANPAPVQIDKNQFFKKPDASPTAAASKRINDLKPDENRTLISSVVISESNKRSEKRDEAQGFIGKQGSQTSSIGEGGMKMMPNLSTKKTIMVFRHQETNKAGGSIMGLGFGSRLGLVLQQSASGSILKQGTMMGLGPINQVAVPQNQQILQKQTTQASNVLSHTTTAMVRQMKEAEEQKVKEKEAPAQEKAFKKGRNAKSKNLFTQNILFKIGKKTEKEKEEDKKNAEDVPDEDMELQEKAQSIPKAPKGQRRYIDFLLAKQKEVLTGVPTEETSRKTSKQTQGPSEMKKSENDHKKSVVEPEEERSKSPEPVSPFEPLQISKSPELISAFKPLELPKIAPLHANPFQPEILPPPATQNHNTNLHTVPLLIPLVSSAPALQPPVLTVVPAVGINNFKTTSPQVINSGRKNIPSYREQSARNLTKDPSPKTSGKYLHIGASLHGPPVTGTPKSMFRQIKDRESNKNLLELGLGVAHNYKDNLRDSKEKAIASILLSHREDKLHAHQSFGGTRNFEEFNSNTQGLNRGATHNFGLNMDGGADGGDSPTVRTSTMRGGPHAKISSNLLVPKSKGSMNNFSPIAGVQRKDSMNSVNSFQKMLAGPNRKGSSLFAGAGGAAGKWGMRA